MFDKDFLWGAASAAHQIEGGFRDDGKGLGIWDYFEQQKGHIKHGETADVSCDHYHRFREDVALMKQIGLKSYRFSISWPRVMPHGTGKVNEKGLQFYSDLVDELLAAGIKPMVTLYHWNLPYELHEKGGWRNPEIPSWFEAYTKAVVERLSDRVEYWMTFNEPQLFVGGGYLGGFHAPFELNDTKTMLEISKHVFLAHGKAVSVIRQMAKRPSLVGLAPTGPVYLPKNDSAEDIEDARQKSFAVHPAAFAFGNAWWADSIFLGRFPEGSEEIFGDKMIRFTQEEWAEVSQKLDFYGFNVYQAETAYPIPKDAYDEYAYQGSPHTMMDWNVTPEVMYWSSRFLYDRYQKPLMITENGMAGMDWEAIDGKVHDPQRIDFLNRYLLQLEKAVDEGIPILGYQYWSIMDNFEWTEGFDKRFGLIHVDYQTCKRTLKDSAYWYKKVIESNGASLHSI
ncbi:GH1 family beta-glucosidase [Anaerobium acetethylicum]|uniref:Beta-glucosidase n=1 Tax=Anaerobium acetethylicum TaxID=1619234 RepID=A0A1D3TNF1_9FIRM|nr:GH1 family beta-glucosidase [Anaerobium acetethylicum]SCP94851.1 beta-glucosidase [Anaerobium acetethylicum]